MVESKPTSLSPGADVPPPTPTQIQIIKSTAPVLEQYGVDITTSFYKNLHLALPMMHEILNQAHQATGHQQRALANTVLAYAQNVEDPSVLTDAIDLIAHKHASLFIQPIQYAVVGTGLLSAIKETLGNAATEDIMSAWAAGFWQVANILIDREQQLYASHAQKDWKPFIIEKKVKESDEVTSFHLKPADGSDVEDYYPGQYISVRVAVPQQQWRQSRQYSLSTNSQSIYYRISVKRVDGIDSKNPDDQEHPGWVSNVLHEQYKEGDSLDLTFPSGTFYLDPEKTPEAPVVLISAGVGLTPVMSMLNTLVDQNSTRPVTWLHATRSQSAYAFGDHIKQVMSEKENWHAIVYNKDLELESEEPNYYVRPGRMDLARLHGKKDLHLHDVDTQYFICGPDSFMVEMQDKLVELGARRENTKYERFGTGDVIRPVMKCPISGAEGVGRCPVAH